MNTYYISTGVHLTAEVKATSVRKAEKIFRDYHKIKRLPSGTQVFHYKPHSMTTPIN